MNENLKKLRQELGLTQTEFAATVGVSKDAVASWETGRNRLSDGMARRIALATGVDARTLQGNGPLVMHGAGGRRPFTRKEYERHQEQFWGPNPAASVARQVQRCEEAVELLFTAAAAAGTGNGAARLAAVLDSFVQWCHQTREDFQLEAAIDAQLAKRPKPVRLNKSYTQWRAMAKADPDAARSFRFVDDPERNGAEILELEIETVPVWWPGGPMGGKH
jgi:transcriptional regulator with XRE-family HTH domain